MWRKIVVGVVGVAVLGSAIVLAQGFQPGPGGEAPGRQQPGPGGQGRGRRQRGPADPGAGRQQQMQQLRRAVMNAPRAMTAHNGKVYMVKQGMLIQLGPNLNIQNSVRVPREAMIRPQLSADGNRVYLSGVRQLIVFNTSNLTEVDTKPLNEITPQPLQGEQGMTPGQRPGREGAAPAPEEGRGSRRSPERREGARPSPEAREGGRRMPEEGR